LDIAPNVVLKRCDVFVMRLAMWTIMAVITRMIIMMTKTMMRERMKRIVEGVVLVVAVVEEVVGVGE